MGATASVVPYTLQNGERRWAVRWRDASGRQRWQTVPGRKKNAEAVARDLEDKLALGPLYEAKPETLGDFLDGWLERYKQRVRPSTYKRRREALRALGVLVERGKDRGRAGSSHAGRGQLKGALPRSASLSGEYLQRLAVADVEDAVSALARRAPRQAQMALATLKLALRNARDRGQRFDEGLLAIAPPRYTEKPPRFLTWAEVERLQSWMPEYVCRIAPIAALTGARVGELFSLTEADLDLDAGVMHICIGKTRASSRAIDLPATAVALLREQLLARTHTAGGLVFPAPKGGRWHKDNFTTRVFRKAAKRAKLEGVTFHHLRHTYASLMARAGADVATIAAQLGHADGGALLLRRYRHLFPGEAKAAAAKLDGLVKEKDREPARETGA